MNIRKCEIHNSSSSMNRRYSLDDLKILIPIIVLREINQKSRSSIINCDVNAWKLI